MPLLFTEMAFVFLEMAAQPMMVASTSVTLRLASASENYRVLRVRGLNDMLRDRLVCGIYDKCIQRRFPQEATLTYDGAFKMALAAESVAKNSAGTIA